MIKNNLPIIQTVNHTYHDEEVKIRWSNTNAYKQSKQRTKNWGKADFDKVTEKGKQLGEKMAETMDKGFDSPEFQELVRQHHAYIEIFYDCPSDLYRSLAESYVSDPRFRASYDDFRHGLAEVLHKAINFYCDQQEEKSESNTTSK